MAGWSPEREFHPHVNPHMSAADLALLQDPTGREAGCASARVYAVAAARIRSAIADEHSVHAHANRFRMQPHCFDGRHDRQLALDRAARIQPGDPYMLFVDQQDEAAPVHGASAASAVRFFLLCQKVARGPVFALYTMNPEEDGEIRPAAGAEGKKQVEKLRQFVLSAVAQMFDTSDPARPDVRFVCPQLPRTRSDYYFALAWTYELLCVTKDDDGKELDVLESIVSREIIVDEREMPMLVLQLLVHGACRYRDGLCSMMAEKGELKRPFLQQHKRPSYYWLKTCLKRNNDGRLVRATVFK